MKPVEVTRDEASLLTAARVAVGVATHGEAQPLLLAAHHAPATLSPRAMKVLQRTLSRGAVLSLTRQGASRVEQGLRLFQRESPPALHFTADSFKLLQWLVAWPLSERDAPALKHRETRTAADELLLLGALTSSIHTPAQQTIAIQPATRSSPLCWLHFAAVLARFDDRTGEVPAPPVVELGDGAPHDFFVRAMQGSLARQWRFGFELLGRTASPTEVTRMARAMKQVIDGTMRAATLAQRRPQLTFLLEALAPLLDTRNADLFVARFDERLSLRERSEARQAVAQLLRTVLSLREWDAHARAVRFIDDDYQQAQAQVKDWEAIFGDARFRAVEAVVNSLESLPG